MDFSQPKVTEKSSDFSLTFAWLSFLQSMSYDTWSCDFNLTKYLSPTSHMWLPMVVWWGMSWSIYSGHSINISFQSWCDSMTLRDYKTSSMLLRSDKYNTYLVVGNNPFNKTIHKHLMSKLGSINRWWLWRVGQVTTELLHLICGLCSQTIFTLDGNPLFKAQLDPFISVQAHKMIMKVAWPVPLLNIFTWSPAGL